MIVRGREAALTLREFDLLLFFARHPGKVFSRRQLMDAVWETPDFEDHAHRSGPHPAPATQDRGGSLGAALGACGLGRGLPLPAVSVRRSLLLLGTAVVLGGVAMSAVYGVRTGLPTALLLALVGAPVLAASHLLVRHRGRLGSLSWQLGAGVALPIALGLLGIEVVALLLFASAHDAFTMALLLASAGTLVAYSACS